VLIYYCIDLKKLWLDQFDEVVVLAVVVIVHCPHLGLIKEGFGIMSQPNLWLIEEGFSRMASQLTHQEVTTKNKPLFNCFTLN
jgi:hypothetical protein